MPGTLHSANLPRLQHARPTSARNARCPASLSRRSVLCSVIPVCTCPACGMRIGRYDKWFAWNMANGMREYEAEVAPVKRQLFGAIPGGIRGLVSRASVLEVGLGTGPNLSYYADKVSSVTGLDPNPYMFDYARDAAAAAGLPADRLTLAEGVVERMPFENDAFDFVVCTLTLCSVKAPETALAEVQRVLKPGGKLLFIEHVRAFRPGLVRVSQTVLDPLQQLLADNCHLTRDTGRLIEEAGFASVEVSRFEVEVASLIAPHVSGVAVAAA